MKQYRLNKEQKIKLEQMWKTGRYNCKQLESYFKISSVAIGGLLKRRGYKIPPVGRFEKGHAKTKNWYLVMKNKVGWSKCLTKVKNIKENYQIGKFYVKGIILYMTKDQKIFTAINNRIRLRTMLQKIKQLLGLEKLPEQYMSGIYYRPNITAIRFEIYKDVSIVFIKKPDTLEYNVFYKRRFYSDKASTLEELKEIAHKDIDTKFINKPF